MLVRFVLSLLLSCLQGAVAFGQVDSGHSHDEREKDDGFPRREHLVEYLQIKTNDRRGTIHLTVRNDGHAWPYLIETRPDCGQTGVDPLRKYAVESHPACGYVAGSLKVSADKSKAYIEVFDVDEAAMNLPFEQRPKKLKCLSQSRRLEINLRRGCKTR